MRTIFFSLLYIIPSSLIGQTYTELNHSQPPPLIASTGSDTVTVDKGDFVVLGGDPAVVGGTEGYTYSWLPVNYLDDPTLSNPGSTPEESITYVFKVTDANGCTSTDTVYLRMIDVTGLDDDLDIDIKIYPNPTDGILFLKIQSDKFQKLDISFYDLNGRLIDKKEWDRDSNPTLSLIIRERIINSLVIIHIKAGESLIVKKVIIK